MYRVVNAAVIFEVLWSLISFGHRELDFNHNAADRQLKGSLSLVETAPLTRFKTSSVFVWLARFWTRAACALPRAHCAASSTNISSFFR